MSRARIPERQKIREQTLMADGYRCRLTTLCRVRCANFPVDRLQVDEIVPRSGMKDAAYIPENCQTLCWKCHHIKTHGEVKASEIIGLYGEKRQNKHQITPELTAWAIETFTKAKSKL